MIEAKYTIYAQTESGKHIKRGGTVHISVVEEDDVRDVMTNMFYFIINEFSMREFNKNEVQLWNLRFLTFKLEDWKIKDESSS